MGGDIGESVITTNRPKLPNILIYGDSFTNPLETLLWTQANELQSIDFRYYTQCTLKDYIAEHKPDIVICVRDETTFLSEAGNGVGIRIGGGIRPLVISARGSHQGCRHAQAVN